MGWRHVRRTQGHRPCQRQIHAHDRRDRPAHPAAGAADRPHPRPRPPEHLRDRGAASGPDRAHPHAGGGDLLVRLPGGHRPGRRLGGHRRSGDRGPLRGTDADRDRFRGDLPGPVRHRAGRRGRRLPALRAAGGRGAAARADRRRSRRHLGGRGERQRSRAHRHRHRPHRLVLPLARRLRAPRLLPHPRPPGRAHRRLRPAGADRRRCLRRGRGRRRRGHRYPRRHRVRVAAGPALLLLGERLPDPDPGIPVRDLRAGHGRFPVRVDHPAHP